MRVVDQGCRVPLRAVEAAYLAIESPEAPMHMGALALFDGPPLLDGEGRLRIDDLRRAVEARLHLLPALRRRVVTGPMGSRFWVDDPDFDIAHHVRRIAVPPPGGEEQLFQLCLDLQAVLLEREQPLWEFWFVEGVAGERVALVEKIHHALADGMAGVAVASVLLDLKPTDTIDEPASWTPRRAPGLLGLAGQAIVHTLRQSMSVPFRAAAIPLHPKRAWAVGRLLLDGGLPFLRDALRSPSQSLNRPVGRDRQLIPVRLPLAPVKEIAHAFDATVNDVLLAAVAGGLRGLLVGRGDRLDRAVKALVPVSVRHGLEELDLGNRTAALLVPLPVDEQDAVERLRWISVRTAERKAHHEAEVTDLVLTFANLVPGLVAAGVRLGLDRQPFVNLVVTNMRGPDVPLYALGARMLEALPIVPLGGNLDVGVAILSYDGQLAVTVHADRQTCPDATVLSGGIGAAVDELGRRAGVRTSVVTGSSSSEESRVRA